MHPKTVCRELVVLLQDPTPSVRAAAAYALGKMKSHRARRWLIQTLADPEADVRRAAAWALGMLSGPHGAQPLQAVALEDRDETVRLEALRALRRLDWPSVESLLETVLQSDDPVRRARAIEQLGERGDFR
ncbi:MAG: HEAT repeat domain-containing protein, partial [Nitrospirae bacterium]